MTHSLVGYSRIDDYPIYMMKFNCNIEVLKILTDNNSSNIFPEISKHLRKFKIQKIVQKVDGKIYENEDLEKFSVFLQYYYNEKGNINIIEQITQ